MDGSFLRSKIAEGSCRISIIVLDNIDIRSYNESSYIDIR